MWTDLVFKGIDILFKRSQNPKKLLNLQKDITKISDISYGTNKNEKFDLYYKEKTKKPTIIMIHGGGFVAGDKKYRTGLSNFYVNNTNINLINLNYVMSNECYIDDSVRSLVKGLNYIYENSDELLVDTTKILITGDSSGAYFAAYLSELSVNEKLQNKLRIKLSLKIRSVFLNCGAYSFKEFLKTKLLGVPQEIFFRCTGKKVIEDYKYKAILNIEDIVTSSFPKTYICDSKADFICGGQGLMLMKKFDELGVKYTKYYATRKEAGHVFQLTWNCDDSKKINTELIQFINDTILK